MTRLQVINRTFTKLVTWVKAISIFLLSWIFLVISHIVSRIILRTKVVGEQNIPEDGAVIVIANHFSWFDAPLLTLHLPCKPAFLVASETLASSASITWALLISGKAMVADNSSTAKIDNTILS